MGRTVALKSLLSLQFLVASLLPFLAALVILFGWLRPQLVKQIEDDQRRIAIAFSGQVETSLAAAAVNLSTLALAVKSQREFSRTRIESIFDDHLRMQSPFDAIYLTTRSGKPVALGLIDVPAPRRAHLLTADISKQQLFMDISKTQVGTWSDTFLSIVTRDNTVAYGMPVGPYILIGEFSVPRLSAAMRKLESRPQAVLMLLDQSKRIIADNTGNYNRQQLNLSNIPLLHDADGKNEVRSEHFYFENEEHIGTAIRVRPVGWTLLIGDDTEVVYQPLTLFIHIFSISAAIACAIGLALALGLSRTLARIIWATKQHAEQVAAGDYKARGPASLFKEIQRINNAIDDIGLQVTHREARLIDSERRFRTLIEQSPEPVFVHQHGIIVYVNPAALVLFGAGSAQDLIDMPVLDRVHPNARELVRTRMMTIAGQSSRLPAIELQFLKVDGTAIDVEAQATPIVFDDKQAVHIAARDITARKQLDSEQRIAAIAFESQEGIYITDADSKILRVNNAFTGITGYTSAEAVGRRPGFLKSGRHNAFFYAAMWDSLARTGAWQGEIWNRHKSGDICVEWLTISTVKDAAGQVTHYVAATTNITQRKMAEEQIRNLASFDALTALPNRKLLMDRLNQALASSARHRRHGALVLLDLDNFKTLNDSRGHDQGDLLLKQVALRLLACVREDDTVGRLGGDEFVVILEDLSSSAQDAATQAEIAVEKIVAALNQTFVLSNFEQHCTPSVGITLFSDKTESPDELLKQADLAMYQAKSAGRNTLRFFDPKMQEIVATRAALESCLREAVAKHNFQLYYQAQINDEDQLVGAEVLLRWIHAKRGPVSPTEFIPLAEETGLILPLGSWVLEAACTQLATWARRAQTQHLTLAVNVSARQFHHADFVNQVLSILDRTGANPQRLKLELTESLLVDKVEDVIARMNRLKEKGVGFSLDDFGTGYSSLSYLKRLPLDQLKIDQGFVRDILVDPNDAAIAKMIVALAKSMGLGVIAEGVETLEQKQCLAGLGCHDYQGYYFSRPIALEAFEEFMRQRSEFQSTSIKASNLLSSILK